MNKRFMVRGRRIDNGEWVTGYYAYYPSAVQVGNICGAHRIYTPPIDPDDRAGYHDVDPATVEPVAVPVVCETVDEEGAEFEFAHYRCPNCLNIVHQHYRKSREPMRYKQNYCVDCGQRLDWEAEK